MTSLSYIYCDLYDLITTYKNTSTFVLSKGSSTVADRGWGRRRRVAPPILAGLSLFLAPLTLVRLSLSDTELLFDTDLVSLHIFFSDI